MKTRTLMLLSLGCGVAIMLAGAVFLFQLTTQDELAEPVGLGEPMTIGEMNVTVYDASTTAAAGATALTVSLDLGGTADDDPAADFRLIASGRPAPLASTTCAAATAEIQSCTLTFDVSVADGSSRVLFYERGDDQARWVLPGD